MQQNKAKNNKPVWIRFMAPVVPSTIISLSQCIDRAIYHGSDHIHLLISSSGGSVFHGISMHNYIKGLPIKVTTYNFGSADSIATVLFCAGSKRICVPHARFLIHPVTLNFNGQVSLKDKDLEEHLKGVAIDTQNIAKIISDTTKKNLEEVENKMHNRTTLNPKESKDFGLTTNIKSNLYDQNGILLSIYEDGNIFEYAPNPAVTANTTQSPVNFYNMPDQQMKQ